MEKNLTPKLTVVMPVYNREFCVQNAIISIINQTFTDWELIVVDDGSTDKTEQVIKMFGDSRIFHYKIPHIGFISKVRNFGNQRARGEWIVVQDSDDISFSNRLEEINKFANTDCDVIYHDINTRFYDTEFQATILNLKKIGEYDKKRILHEQYIPGQIAYRRDIILKIPYDERITVCDDFQILIELTLNNCRFKYIDQCLYEYTHSRGDSANVLGEIDGRRFEDTRVIISILKEKYNLAAVGELKKWETMTGAIIKQQYVTK